MTDQATGPTAEDLQGHFPHSIGGPLYQTVCSLDGEPWPCDTAAAAGAEPLEPRVDDAIAGPSIEGTGAHTVTIEGEATPDQLAEAGIPAEAVAAIAAAPAPDTTPAQEPTPAAEAPAEAPASTPDLPPPSADDQTYVPDQPAPEPAPTDTPAEPAGEGS